MPERFRFPTCATAPGGPKVTSRHAPTAWATCRRPCLPLRGCRRDRDFCRVTPLARIGADKNGPLTARSSPRDHDVSRVGKQTLALVELQPDASSESRPE